MDGALSIFKPTRFYDRFSSLSLPLSKPTQFQSWYITRSASGLLVCPSFPIRRKTPWHLITFCHERVRKDRIVRMRIATSYSFRYREKSNTTEKIKRASVVYRSLTPLVSGILRNNFFSVVLFCLYSSYLRFSTDNVQRCLGLSLSQCGDSFDSSPLATKKDSRRDADEMCRDMSGRSFRLRGDPKEFD